MSRWVPPQGALLRGIVSRLPEPRGAETGPVRLLRRELAECIAPIPRDTSSTALVLITLHGEPVGTLQFSLEHNEISEAELRAEVVRVLAGPLRAHLLSDGLMDSTDSGEWTCLREMRARGGARVSVVIPTRDRPAQLKTCLDSVLCVDYPDYEVIVVDNTSAESSTERMVRSQFGHADRVRYLREERPGASLARNTGAASGTGEFVAFTDDDAVVDKLWLAALVSGFHGNPRITCVAGLTLPSELETRAQQAFEAYGSMALGYERRVYDLHEHRGDTLLYPYTAGIFGASNNVAFRRRSFLERGGFDVVLGPGTPTFGAEDLDAFLSHILDGYQILYEPRAMVLHEHRREFADLYWQVFTYSAGFTALLTKWALTDRDVARDLSRRVPRLLPAALLRRHRGGAESGADVYPATLRWLERAGYLYGPVAYARSTVHCRSSGLGTALPAAARSVQSVRRGLRPARRR